MIADSRIPKPNTTVPHSIFTQKWRADTDRYPKLLEVPLFAHSENHGAALSELQFRYQDGSGQMRGGVTVSDPTKRSGGLIFEP